MTHASETKKSTITPERTHFLGERYFRHAGMLPHTNTNKAAQPKSFSASEKGIP
jgi:hypothetical protein